MPRISRIALYMRSWEVMCYLADSIQNNGDGYSSLIVTAGAGGRVLARNHSRRLRPGIQVARKMYPGYDQDSGQVFSIYDTGIGDQLLRLSEKLAGQMEMDGALVVDDDGRVVTEAGMRLLIGDIERLESIKPLESGTGRNFLAAATLLPGVRGYMRMGDEPYSVRMYNDGWCIGEYDPRRRVARRYKVVPAGHDTKTDGRRKRIPSRELDMNSGVLTIFGPDGETVRAVRKRKPSVLSV